MCPKKEKKIWYMIYDASDFYLIYLSVFLYLKFWNMNGLRKTTSPQYLRKKRIQIWMMWKLSLKILKYVQMSIADVMVLTLQEISVL